MKPLPAERSSVKPLNYLSSRGSLSADLLRTAERFRTDVAEASRWKGTGKEEYRAAAERLSRVLTELGPLRVVLFACAVKNVWPHEWAEQAGHRPHEGLVLLRVALTSLVAIYAAERSTITRSVS